MRTPLSKVKGLGSAKSGTHHFWAQRVTAIALVPLFIWFLISVVALIGADHQTVMAWIGNPIVTVLLLCLLFALFYHAKLGLQVVIEDYVHSEGLKLFSLLGVNGLVILVGLSAILAVLKISFGS